MMDQLESNIENFFFKYEYLTFLYTISKVYDFIFLVRNLMCKVVQAKVSGTCKKISSNEKFVETIFIRENFGFNLCFLY